MAHEPLRTITDWTPLERAQLLENLSRDMSDMQERMGKMERMVTLMMQTVTLLAGLENERRGKP